MDRYDYEFQCWRLQSTVESDCSSPVCSLCDLAFQQTTKNYPSAPHGQSAPGEANSDSQPGVDLPLGWQFDPLLLLSMCCKVSTCQFVSLGKDSDLYDSCCESVCKFLNEKLNVKLWGQGGYRIRASGATSLAPKGLEEGKQV